VKLSVKIALYLILSVVIDRALGYFISTNVQAYQYDNRIEKIINKQIDAKTVVIGSSRALIDVDACLLSDKLNRKVYNLGFSGSTVDFHLFVLQLLENTKQFPDTCLLVLDERKTFTGSESAFFRTDFLMPYISDDFVYQKVCEKDKSVYPVGLASSTYRQNNNTINALTYLVRGQLPPDNTSDINSCGSVLISEQSPNFKPTEEGSMKLYDADEENLVFIDAFNEIQKICQKHHSTLLLIYPPNFAIPNPDFKTRVRELTHISATEIQLDTLHFKPDYFYDHGHLQKKGSIEFTNKLANQILQL
tara:strand:+ start:19 stop:933 length:915 start_codon:yes stop_codon:yes gene_type:complete